MYIKILTKSGSPKYSDQSAFGGCYYALVSPDGHIYTALRQTEIDNKIIAGQLQLSVGLVSTDSNKESIFYAGFC